MYVQPSVLALLALARSDPDPDFVNPIILASSDMACPDTNPASVFLETSRHLAPASVNRAFAHTSGLLAPQLPSTQLHPVPETRSFIVPTPAGSDPITHLANITGAAMSSAPDIDTFIKGCHFQTVTAPTPSAYKSATPLLHSLTPSGFPYAVSKPWYLKIIKAAIRKGPHKSTRNPASTTLCRAELAYRV